MDESDPFEIPSRCEDSLDNDADGLVDLRDPGCTSRDDDDEADPAEVPACANEVDDDEDGLIDWPEDPGCQARGTPENQDCRAEVELIDISAEGSYVGSTQEGGADRYDSRCGGLERLMRCISTSLMGRDAGDLHGESTNRLSRGSLGPTRL